MSKNTGGPAFPGFDYIDQFGKKNPEGMTLRDYFAAKAMEGVLAGTLTPDYVWSAEDVAKTAYKMADAMLAEREKE